MIANYLGVLVLGAVCCVTQAFVLGMLRKEDRGHRARRAALQPSLRKPLAPHTRRLTTPGTQAQLAFAYSGDQ